MHDVVKRQRGGGRFADAFAGAAKGFEDVEMRCAEAEIVQIASEFRHGLAVAEQDEGAAVWCDVLAKA
jgi:hypothetical protein